MQQTIGFVGTGAMGLPIALNLLADGHTLRVFNRSRSKTTSLADKGAEIVDSPADVCQEGGIVITMLSDDRALRAVAVENETFSRRLGMGGVHVSMSTVSPETSREVERHHRRFGAHFLAAPVFGRPDAAAVRKLWICLAGDSSARSRVRPVLGPLGQGMFEFGDDPGAASVVKLAGNFLIASTIESLGEALALGEKNGIGRSTLVELFGKTLFSCPAVQIYGKKIAEESYPQAGFTLTLGLKDVGLVLQTAGNAGVSMPLAQLLQERMRTVLERGRADWDWSALALLASEESGLK